MRIERDTNRNKTSCRLAPNVEPLMFLKLKYYPVPVLISNTLSRTKIRIKSYSFGSVHFISFHKLMNNNNSYEMAHKLMRIEWVYSLIFFLSFSRWLCFCFAFFRLLSFSFPPACLFPSISLSPFSLPAFHIASLSLSLPSCLPFSFHLPLSLSLFPSLSCSSHVVQL